MKRWLFILTIVVVCFAILATCIVVGLTCNKSQILLHKELSNRTWLSVFPRELVRHPPPSPPQRGIPKQIFRTWKDNSWQTKCRKAYDHTAQIVPGWPQKVFTDKQCDDFVKTVFSKYPEIIEAYDLCNYGVMKADLWRYLVIYHHGGLYLDMKSAVVKPINLELDVKKAYVSTWSIPNHSHLFSRLGEHEQWWVMAPPKSEFLWKVIWQVVRNILYIRDRGIHRSDFLKLTMGHYSTIKSTILCCTGPIVFTYISTKYSDLVIQQNSNCNQIFKYVLDTNEHTVNLKSHYSKQTKPILNSVKVDIYHQQKLHRGLSSTKNDVFPIPILYINLVRSQDRNAHIQKELTKYHANFKRIVAVDANVHSSKPEYESYDGVKCIPNPRLSLRQVACTLSHVKAVEYAYHANYEYVLILEDDVSFDFVQYWPTHTIARLILDAPSDTGIIQLAWVNLHGPRCRPTGKIQITPYNKHCWSCAAYIVTRLGMEDVLYQATTPIGIYRIPHVSDKFVYESTKVVKSGTPIIMPDENFASTINESRMGDSQVEGMYKRKDYVALQQMYKTMTYGARLTS